MKNEKPWYVPFKCQWSSVKMYEQNNQVIIILIVTKTFTFIPLILDYNKIHTIIKLI